MPADYPDFTRAVSIKSQEVDLSMVIEACNVVLNTAIQSCEAVLSTVIEAVNVTVDTRLTGQTVDISAVIEAVNTTVNVNIETCAATINQIITGQTVDVTQIINGQNVGVYDRMDWAAKGLEYKTWNDNFSIDPASSQSVDVYTVPAGKILFVTDVEFGGMARGLATIWASAIKRICWMYFEPFDSRHISLTVPLPLVANDTLKVYEYNYDIIPGTFSYLIISWEQAASEPEKPKSDDPEELYRCGEFNHCEIFHLPGNEQVFIFAKARETVMHYLNVKNYGKPDQKKLASFHLKPEEVREILDIRRGEPQKVKEVLKKIEDKYKKL